MICLFYPVRRSNASDLLIGEGNSAQKIARAQRTCYSSDMTEKRPCTPHNDRISANPVPTGNCWHPPDNDRISPLKTVISQTSHCKPLTVNPSDPSRVFVRASLPYYSVPSARRLALGRGGNPPPTRGVDRVAAVTAFQRPGTPALEDQRPKNRPPVVPLTPRYPMPHATLRPSRPRPCKGSGSSHSPETPGPEGSGVAVATHWMSPRRWQLWAFAPSSTLHMPPHRRGRGRPANRWARHAADARRARPGAGSGPLRYRSGSPSPGALARPVRRLVSGMVAGGRSHKVGLVGVIGCRL